MIRPHRVTTQYVLSVPLRRPLRTVWVWLPNLISIWFLTVCQQELSCPHSILLPWRGEKICLQDSVSANWNPWDSWTRRVITEKEIPGWPASIAHLGCLQKSILILLSCTRIALNYTGYEIISCLCPLVTRMLEGTAEKNPHSTLGETQGLRSKVTANVTQPIWWQTSVPDSSIFHQAACQQLWMKHPKKCSQQHASPPKYFTNIQEWPIKSEKTFHHC